MMPPEAYAVKAFYIGVREPLNFVSCPSAVIVPRIELPSIAPFPVTGSS